jgi:hypothetical protein
MPHKRFLLAVIFLTSFTGVGLSTECDSNPAKEVSLDLWSTRSLLSPDQRWKFLSLGPHSPEKKAPLYIQSAETSKKWLVGWIERNGTAFWSGDSKRLFLRDEYAADDTKIRVFDVTGPVPKEIKGLDDKIQQALFARIPPNKATQWLYYPEVCFAADDSSTIIVLADAPLVPKKESGSGVPFSAKLTVNLVTREVEAAVPTARLSVANIARYFREDGGTGAMYIALDSNGGYTVTAREHMFVRVEESGRWSETGSRIAFVPTKSGASTYSAEEASYKRHVFLALEGSSGPSIELPVAEIKQSLDQNPKELPLYVFFEISGNVYEQETKQTYPFHSRH